MEKDTFTMNEKPRWSETLRALPFTIRLIRDVDPLHFYLNIAVSLLGGPLSFVSVLAIKRLTDALTTLSGSRVFVWGAALIAIELALSFSNVLRDWMSDLQRFKTEVALEEKKLKHLSSLPYRIVEDPGFQALATAYNRRSYLALQFQTNGFRVFQTGISLLGMASAFYLLPWTAATFALLGLFATGAVFIIFPEWSWNVLSRETREGRRINYYQQTLSQPSLLMPAQALELPGPFLKAWRKLSMRILDAKMDQAKKSGRVYLLGGLLMGLGEMFGLLTIIPKTLSQALPISAFVVFLTTYQRLSSTLESFSWNINYLLQESSVLPVIKRFFEVEPEKDTGRSVPKESLVVAFEDVWFRYPGSGQDVLRGLNLTMAQGEQVALVGLNGAGKTTILKLLMRVYEPTRGRITVNGIDLREIKPSAWRKALAVLTQSDAEYDDVLEEQVQYGDYSQPRNDLRFRKAIAASGLKDLAKEFPRGMKTHAGKYFAMPEDEAIELSGGQRQIVAIARTLYRDARFYVFDEPTSAVDAEKEERFFQMLPSAVGKGGAIFVSHRFSTLRRGAERIVVIDQGRVIEDGTHEELVGKQGRYAELFTLQAKSYQ